MNTHEGRPSQMFDRVLIANRAEIVCPKGAACLVAARQLREAGWLEDPDQVVMRLPYLRKAAPDVLATARARRWDPAKSSACC